MFVFFKQKSDYILDILASEFSVLKNAKKSKCQGSEAVDQL